MKLLLDENLSRRLVPALQQDFPGSSQVALLGLERASDADLWQVAHDQGFVLVTKDDDFTDLQALHGYPPKLVILRLGNCTNQQVLDALLGAAQRIRHSLADDAVGKVGHSRRQHRALVERRQPRRRLARQFQMPQDALDGFALQDRRDHPQPAAAVRAVLQVELEDPCQQLDPGDVVPAFGLGRRLERAVFGGDGLARRGRPRGPPAGAAWRSAPRHHESGSSAAAAGAPAPPAAA